MAEGFEAFHVPQQSRRDKLRVLAQSHSSCEAAAAALQGCPGLLPLYDPSLLSSEMLSCSNVGAQEYHHQKNPLSETGEVCKQNPLSVIKEGVNLMGYVSGFVNPSTSSSSSHPTYLDPQSSLALNPGSIQDINGNPFFYTAHNLRDLDNSFNGGEMVAFKPESLLLSLSSNPTVQNNPSLELNYLVRGVPGGGGSTSSDVSRSPLGPFTGYTSVLKGSRFLKPAQQVLEEFCYVGRGIYGEKSCGESSLMDPSMESLSGAAIGEDPLTCGDGSEHRRKKTVLLSMLDEVYRRYKLYYQQLQAVVASFESVAGLCNAAPYTSFALKIMLKHFNCLKNGIIGQLRFTGKTLGEGSYEKDGNPRLGTTERVLQSQKPGHNLGILEHQHVWRPQRGLPEHAVAVLRAWLFEHFLHPYPTDTDKQMLAKQTGLSRGQVSNWFINARVRLWKPMVEEIHTLETQQTLKASEAEERILDKPVHHPPSPYSLSDKQPQNTPTQMPQDPPSKRSRNILPTVPDKNDEPKNFSYHNLSSQHHVSVGGIGVSATGGNSGVSLTLGLPQNNGIGLSEPLPMNLSHHFGIDASSEGYVIGGFETPNQHFGKDIGGQLLHDFVG